MEGGFVDWMLKKKVTQGFDIGGIGTNPEGSLWVDRYASAHLDLPPMPDPGIKLYNVKKLFILYICLISFSLTVLLYEKSWYRIRKLLEQN